MAYKRSRQTFEADAQKQASPFVHYGTPLPPLDDNVRDDGSFVPAWKQEVTDERGRKRLHGAFTGGFSAGYFNSVGSKEGWTPSSFVSSRQNRIKDAPKSAQQRPEDFMDEEDFREAEESRTLNTSREFSGFGTENDAMRKTATIDIFRPLDETIGVKLLKRMGWKEGHGIGPRVRRAAKLGNDDDDPNEIHVFAPDDVQVVSLARKTDFKGLGYEGELGDSMATVNRSQQQSQRPTPLEESSDDEGMAPLLSATKKTISQRKRGGFGVGVLNDDGSDDEDPYSMGPRISYNKVVGGGKKSKSKPQTLGSSANPLLKNKPTFISKKLANLKGALRKCHDGRLPPDGFVLADQLDSLGTMTLQDDKFKPPQVPEEWKSSISRDTGVEADPAFTSTAAAARASTLTAKSRASLLGESQLPGKSIFDFLTPAARDRLAVASGRQNLPKAGNETPSEGFKKSESASETLQSHVPYLDRDVALQALNRGDGGWMPYAEDENKRTRYRTYLEIQAGLRPAEGGDELPPRAQHMRQEDWIREMQEFTRAAEVFKPISGLMASRFTTSTSLPQGQNGEPGTTTVDSLLTRASAKPEDPAESAAKMGMFGPMTRSVSNFFPTRLLCKRFGVPVPTHGAGNGNATPNAEPSAAAAVQLRSFASAAFQVDASSAVNVPKKGGDGKGYPDLGALETEREQPTASVAMDPDRNEALDQERPGQAVFKAIFGSDDEDG